MDRHKRQKVSDTMIKVLAVFGTRPEGIKMCPVILELAKHKNIECCVCLTGQHEEMLMQVMKVFGVREDYNLHIMKQKQTLGSITTSVLNTLGHIVQEEKPDIILVHGDTTTSFAAALTGFYAGIAVGHVEAGLRTYNMKSPYPEEFNRQAVDLIADLYFAPTQTAKENLLKEGKAKEKIYVTGNTVIDAMKTTVIEDYENEDFKWLGNSRLLLVTAHRRENIGEPMHHMLRAIKRVVDEFSDVKVIYPVHLNPVVREIADTELGNHDRIRLIDPLDVMDFHNYMARSFLILTDSGGIQEEAPSLGKPVLVMRDTTERPEGIAAGTLKLVGTDETRIYDETVRLLTDKEEYQRMSLSSNPYGDGQASERIAGIILRYFAEKE